MEEKSYQVTMMSSIYSGAQMVFMWLGLEMQDVVVNLELLEDLGSSIFAYLEPRAKVGYTLDLMESSFRLLMLSHQRLTLKDQKGNTSSSFWGVDLVCIMTPKTDSLPRPCARDSSPFPTQFHFEAQLRLSGQGNSQHCCRCSAHPPSKTPAYTELENRLPAYPSMSRRVARCMYAAQAHDSARKAVG